MLYGIRHLQVHNNGVVDEKHLARFSRGGWVLGERVSVSLADAHEALALAKSVVSAV